MRVNVLSWPRRRPVARRPSGRRPPGRTSLAGSAARTYGSIVIDSTSIETTDRAVQRFKALGDPTRLQVLHVLREGRRCVCEIQTRVAVAPNVLSHHLKVLREAGLVQAERRGRWIDYRLDPDGLAELAAALPTADPGTAAARCACGPDDAGEVHA